MFQMVYSDFYVNLIQGGHAEREYLKTKNYLLGGS